MRLKNYLSCFVKSKVTLFLLILCIGLFFIGDTIDTSLFLFDSPMHMEVFSEQHAQIEDAEQWFPIWIENYARVPYWLGYQTIYLFKLDGIDLWKLPNPPLFEKISQGELWRLVTPIFFHGSLIHLLMNMLCLCYIGPEFEKIFKVRGYLLFIVVSAIISNICGYLVVGYNGIGLSGVILAMGGFLWIKDFYNQQSIGVQVCVSAIVMAGAYLIGLFGYGNVDFELQGVNIGQIDHAAHMSGMVVGMAWAYATSQLPKRCNKQLKLELDDL